MANFAVSIGALVVGVVATILVSRYYFKRTVAKALTPYIQFHSSLFEGVDPSVRESLKVAYKGTPVTELLEVQFLIANTGERPIRDLIAPLSVAIPSGCSILDATILHVAPEGREVTIAQEPGKVHFTFPLLNSGEFFITKLLLQGRAKPKDFRFTVTVDDLPPALDVVPLSDDLIESERKRRFEWQTFLIGVTVLLIACAFAGLIYLQRGALLSVWHFGIFAALRQNWLAISCAIFAIVPTVGLFVLGPMVIFAAFSDFSFPRRRRFRVPAGFHRRHFSITR